MPSLRSRSSRDNGYDTLGSGSHTRSPFLHRVVPKSKKLKHKVFLLCLLSVVAIVCIALIKRRMSTSPKGSTRSDTVVVEPLPRTESDMMRLDGIDEQAKPGEKRVLWAVLSSVMMPDTKGCDLRFQQILDSVVLPSTTNDESRYDLVFVGAFSESLWVQQHHHDALKQRYAGALLDLQAPLEQNFGYVRSARLEKRIRCDEMLVYFWPNVAVWRWVATFLSHAKRYYPKCKVTFIIDEIPWERHRMIQESSGRHSEDVPMNWEMLRVQLLRYVDIAADKFVFVSPVAQRYFAQHLISKRQAMYHVPFYYEKAHGHTARSLPTARGAGALEERNNDFAPAQLANSAHVRRSGVLVISFYSDWYVTVLKNLVALMATMPKEVGDLHVVGHIATTLNGALDNHPRVVVHGHLSESELMKLESSVLCLLNPMDIAVGGVSTKSVRAITGGLPVVYVGDVFVDHGNDMCKHALPNPRDHTRCAHENDSDCFVEKLSRLATDSRYWSTVSKCQQEFALRHFSREVTDRAVDQWLLATPQFERTLPPEPAVVIVPRPPSDNGAHTALQKSLPPPAARMLITTPTLTRGGVYVCALLRNMAPLWPHFRNELLRFVKHVSADRKVHVRFVSSNNEDNTLQLLRDFESALSPLDNVQYSLWLAERDDRNSEMYAKDRPRYLAKMRNIAVEKLTVEYETVLFMNDIYTTMEDMLALIETPVQYDMVCGLDLMVSVWGSKDDFRLITMDERELVFYDIWVARERNGQHFFNRWPYVADPLSRRAMEQGLPFQVYSCWNGIVAIKASAFLEAGIRFRAPFEPEKPACEAELICNDMWDMGMTRIFVNPRVHVAYNEETWEYIQKWPYHLKFNGKNRAPRPVTYDIISARPNVMVKCPNPQQNNNEPDYANCRQVPKFSRYSILLRGNFIDQGSIAEVNRLLYAGLSRHGRFIVRAMPIDGASKFPGADIDRSANREEYSFLNGTLLDPDAVPTFDLCIVSMWPTSLHRCSNARKSVLFVPWEMGALPTEWIIPMNYFDEIWVTSSYLRPQFTKSGIIEKKIRVFPNPISNAWLDAPIYADTIASTMGRTMSHLPLLPRAVTAKHFDVPLDDAAENGNSRLVQFLFLGGLLPRKGVDLLLEAFWQEFHPVHDKVCLVMHMSYRHGMETSVFDELETKQAQTYGAHGPRLCIKWKFGFVLSQQELVRMVLESDALVLPYRAEGFGLPIVEAMAAGVPVITTKGGASDDFGDFDTVIKVDSTEEVCDVYPCRGKSVCFWWDHRECLDTMSEPVWRVPKVDSIRKALRYVYNDASHASETSNSLRSRTYKAAHFAATTFSAAASAQRVLDALMYDMK